MGPEGREGGGGVAYSNRGDGSPVGGPSTVSTRSTAAAVLAYPVLRLHAPCVRPTLRPPPPLQRGIPWCGAPQGSHPLCTCSPSSPCTLALPTVASHSPALAPPLTPSLSLPPSVSLSLHPLAVLSAVQAGPQPTCYHPEGFYTGARSPDEGGDFNGGGGDEIISL